METLPYYRFTGPARLEKGVQTLLGILQGIELDKRINPDEVHYLNAWLEEYREEHHLHPFNELVPVVKSAIADHHLDAEEHADLSELCQRLLDRNFYANTTRDMQRLHGVLAGIIADNHVSATELRGLRDWLDDHTHLMRRWPYDEISAVLSHVLRDGKVDDEEHSMLLAFFNEFIAHADDRTITTAPVMIDGTIKGVCAVDPEIIFDGKRFCFTGGSNRHTRSQFHALVESRGGIASSSVSRKTDYLVIGADGNPCWAYACYGRKVEQTITLRKEGAQVMIIHELDFNDALND